MFEIYSILQGAPQKKPPIVPRAVKKPPRLDQGRPAETSNWTFFGLINKYRPNSKRGFFLRRFSGLPQIEKWALFAKRRKPPPPNRPDRGFYFCGALQPKYYATFLFCRAPCKTQQKTSYLTGVFFLRRTLYRIFRQNPRPLFSSGIPKGNSYR